eukprot:s7_g70.t1
MKPGFLINQRLAVGTMPEKTSEKTETTVKINYNTGKFEDPTSSTGFHAEKTSTMTKVTHDNKNFNVKIQNGQFICTPTEEDQRGMWLTKDSADMDVVAVSPNDIVRSRAVRKVAGHWNAALAVALEIGPWDMKRGVDTEVRPAKPPETPLPLLHYRLVVSSLSLMTMNVL